MSPFQSYWSPAYDLPMITLPMLTHHVSTPPGAEKLAVSADILADILDKRGDHTFALLLRDVAAGLRDHAKALEHGIELQAKAFRTQLETGDTDD